PACVQRMPSRRTRARLLHRSRAGATAIARTGRRLGARARTTYRVTLLRRCVVVATGSVRDRRLVLRVRRTETRTIVRDGRRTTVATYPRLSGSYVLRPGRSGARIAATIVAFGR
ncbi:MAG TPA: hypothetical protein VGV67_04855, partial [Solirubrobacteraceae bacterium]|nr:hypothetical protein [Solirubrobacteraceae bacterium]